MHTFMSRGEQWESKSIRELRVRRARIDPERSESSSTDRSLKGLIFSAKLEKKFLQSDPNR